MDTPSWESTGVHHLTITLNYNLKVLCPQRRQYNISRLRNWHQDICLYLLKDIHVARNDQLHRLINVLLATTNYEDIKISLYWPILDQNSRNETSISYVLLNSPEIHTKFHWSLWNVRYQAGMIKSSYYIISFPVFRSFSWKCEIHVLSF